MKFFSTPPNLKVPEDDFYMRDDDILQFLSEESLIDYSYEDFKYVLGDSWLEAKGIIWANTIEEHLEMYRIRDELKPLRISYENVKEMFEQIANLKVSVNTDKKRKTKYNVSINDNNYLFSDHDEINSIKYEIDLYEKEYLGEYEVAGGLSDLIKDHEEKKVLEVIAEVIKEKVNSDYTTDKKQKLLFPKKEKEDAEDRKSLRLFTTAKSLLSDSGNGLLENISMYLEGSESPSSKLLNHLDSALNNITNIYLDENLIAEEIYSQEHKLRLVYYYESGVVYQ